MPAKGKHTGEAMKGAVLPALTDAEKQDFNKSLEYLKKLNVSADGRSSTEPARKEGKLNKVLIANRGEIAKRFFLALHEENIPSVAVITDADRGQSWYEFADEELYIGANENYTGINIIIAAAVLSGANAIYAGYGFLSENHGFVKRIRQISEWLGTELIFMGPRYDVMEVMGDKISAREVARKNGVPLFESSDALSDSDIDHVKKEAARIGYPVIIKLSAGGGGKGMYPVFSEGEIESAVQSTCRIGRELYNDSSFYMEKFIQRPVHIEVQVFNGSAIGIRKCAVQRRNQKIIEESGHTFLEDHQFMSFLSSAERLAIASGYSDGCGAGTVEFLIDSENGSFGFMEMNTRLQVEYAVTDQSLGIDLVKWQIMFYDGRGNEIANPQMMKYKTLDRYHSIECRIYAEDPENDYLPSPGSIVEVDLPTFNGIRCDFGFTKGDNILPMYDPMIGKLIAHGSTRREAIIRLERALQEFYVKGIKTNTNQLLQIVRHPEFQDGGYSNKLLDDNPELQFKAEAEKNNACSSADTIEPVIFGAFCEYISALHRAAQDYAVIVSLEGAGNAPAVILPPAAFTVQYRGGSSRVDFLQTEIDSFIVSLNGVNQGRVTLSYFNDRDDDFIVQYGTGSKRIRCERQSDMLVVKLRDSQNKANYHRMLIVPEGQGAAANEGLVKSPFQGTFVSLGSAGLEVGTDVKAGDPLIVLSSMKMETVVKAPVDGTIEYLIEDGDESRLVLSKTPDGRIIGRSIQEGEVLVRIKTEDVDDSETCSGEKKVNTGTTALDLLRSGVPVENIVSNIEKHFDDILEMFLASVKGFISDSVLIDSMIEVLEKIDHVAWGSIINEKRAEGVNDIVLHYTNIRKIFSPVISENGFSYQDELDRYSRDWNEPGVKFPGEFTSLINELLVNFGISSAKPSNVMEEIYRAHFNLLMRLSYDYCVRNWKRIGPHFNVVTTLLPSMDKTLLTMKRLLLHTQTESDDSAYKKIRSYLIEKYPHCYAEFSTGGWSDIPNIEKQLSGNGETVTCEPSGEHEFIESLLPEGFNEVASRRMEEKLALLKLKYNIKRLKNSPSDTSVYRLEPIDPAGEVMYAAFTAIDAAGGSVMKNVRSAFTGISEAICRVTGDCCSTPNWIEVILTGHQVVIDCDGSEDRPGYGLVKSLASDLDPYFCDRNILAFALDTELAPSADAPSARKTLVLAITEGRPSFTIMQQDDAANPYSDSKQYNRKNQSLYDDAKWPIDVWAEETLDKGTSRELTIPSIDDDPENPVAARIILGSMNGTQALFYMKDFRIRGGSTGDREGRKYVAAGYIALMKGIPLYVWNDSGGANIKEGVVSLNRGAQGFMMNTFLAGTAGIDKFLRYRKNLPDSGMSALFDELDSMLSLNEAEARRGKAMLVAIGIGASAGLDVYGSSQATIQLLLDSQKSYRVLTGANVIRAVMGEDISNYDIGGAKVLGKWAGIVDLVAGDRVEMVAFVRKIHSYFCALNTASEQIEAPLLNEAADRAGDGYTVFTETTVHRNVDGGRFWTFKDDYYGANALIGGFASLRGNRALIMGPRTNSGLTTSPSLNKSRELLRIAQRTGVHQILVFGKCWHRVRSNIENVSMRPRMDFVKTLGSGRSGARIHIVTDIEGLKAAEINSYADFIIFIKDRELPQADYNFARKNTSFMVESFSEAFSLSADLLGLLSNPEIADSVKPEIKPDIPSDSGEPYDMIERVINRTFDSGSFIEVYRGMNDPMTGPNLITGLARLNGRTVGIIADQPLVKGGGADSAGTEKFRIFVELLSSRNIPLVMLSNSSGFVPGSKEERFRIQAIGADSLDVNIESTIPVVSVVLNQNFGGRMIHAFNRYLRPGIVYLALDHAVIAVLGETVAFELLQKKEFNRLISEGKQQEAEEFYRQAMSAFREKARAENDCLATGVLDWVIKDSENLREHLLKGMEKAVAEASTIA